MPVGNGGKFTPEARAIYDHAADQRARRRRQGADAENRLGKTVPAVNG